MTATVLADVKAELAVAHADIVQLQRVCEVLGLAVAELAATVERTTNDPPVNTRNLDNLLGRAAIHGLPRGVARGNRGSREQRARSVPS